MTRVLAITLLGAGACGGAPAAGPDPGCGSVAEVEARIVLPKCGAPGDGSCHATGPVPPRLAAVGAMAENLLDRMGEHRCRRDAYVSRADPEASYLLAKIRPRGRPTATCADGSNGGPPMPYQDAPALTAAEAACIEWWVREIAADRAAPRAAPVWQR